MINAFEPLLSAQTLVCVLNAAIASLAAFGLALVLSHRRGWSLPLRHAILVSAISASLLVPVGVLLFGGLRLAPFQIAVEAMPEAPRLADASSNFETDRDALPTAVNEPSGQIVSQLDARLDQRPTASIAKIGVSTRKEASSFPLVPRPEKLRNGIASRARVAGTVLTAIWVLGTLIEGIRAIVRCTALARWSRTFYASQSPDLHRAMRVAADRIGMRRPVIVLRSDVVPAPVTIGLIRPRVVVPSGLESELPFEQLCAVMQHEVAHILRRDLLIGVMQQLAQIVYWWNPLVRVANSRLSDLREQICDDIATCGLVERREYAASLVDIAARSAKGIRLPASLGIGASPIRQLEERVRRIIGSQAPSSVHLERGAAFGVLGIAAMMTATMLFAQVRLRSPEAKPDAARAPQSAIPSINSPLPSLQELCQKIAEWERAYLPYYIKATETFRMTDGRTPSERTRYPWADGRKHQRLMEYAQSEDRHWFRKETLLVDGVADDRIEEYSNGQRLVKVSLRKGKPRQVDIEHVEQFETKIPRWVMANPLRGVFPLAVWSNSDLFSRVFAGKESQIQLDWDGDDARLTFEFGPPGHESRFVLWLSRAHDWHPVKLQRFMGKKATVFHDEWIATRFRPESHWRVADGTIHMRNFHDLESPNAKTVYSIDFQVTDTEYGIQGSPPAGSSWKPMFGPGHANRMFEYQVPVGVDVHDDQRAERQVSHVGRTHGGSTPLTIHVVDLDGKPIAGAVVQLFGRLDPRQVDRVQTDDAGVAQSQTMLMRDGYLRATAAGYRPATWGFNLLSFHVRAALIPQTHGVAVDEKGIALPSVWLPAEVVVFRTDGLPHVRVPGPANNDWGDKDGRFVLKSELTLHDPNKPVRLMGVDERAEKMAIAFVVPKDLDKTQTLVFRPVCHVHGGCLLEGIAETSGITVTVEADNGVPIAKVSPHVQKLPQGLRLDWDFRLPDGTYQLTSRQSSYRSGFSFQLPLTIAQGQTRIDMGLKTIAASGLTALRGKPARELEVQWRHGQETTLEKLHGRVVVLYFWGTWCIPCIDEMPELMDIAHKFHDRPVEWIAIHTPKRSGFESLDSDLVDLKRRVWKNRDLTFKTVIDRPVPVDEHSGITQVKYGIAEWPTLVLIDQQGEVVGPVSTNRLAANISRLLDRQSAK